MSVTDKIYNFMKEKFMNAKKEGIPFMDISSQEIIIKFNLLDHYNDVCNLMKRFMSTDDFCLQKSNNKDEINLIIRYYLKDK